MTLCKTIQGNYMHFKILDNMNNIISEVEGYYEINNNFNITNLYTDELHRNKYLATTLINCIKNTVKINKCISITVDDCTDRFLQTHNIYINNDFTYVTDGLPEMIFYLPCV